jgi:hypothetical protein
MLEEKYKK